MELYMEKCGTDCPVLKLAVFEVGGAEGQRVMLVLGLACPQEPMVKSLVLLGIAHDNCLALHPWGFSVIS